LSSPASIFCPPFAQLLPFGSAVTRTTVLKPSSPSQTYWV
jgi:hypothetical protein